MLSETTLIGCLMIYDAIQLLVVLIKKLAFFKKHLYRIIISLSHILHIVGNLQILNEFLFPLQIKGTSKTGKPSHKIGFNNFSLKYQVRSVFWIFTLFEKNLWVSVVDLFRPSLKNSLFPLRGQVKLFYEVNRPVFFIVFYIIFIYIPTCYFV